MNVYGGHRQRGRKPFGGSAKHAAKRGRRFPDGQTMFGAEPRWACWRVDVDPRWPLFLSRDDLAAIRARWFDLADAEGVDPDRLKKGRGRLYELSSLIVADLIEAGAESKAIAAALGFSRQRVAERKAKAAELLGRPIVRPKIFGGAGSSFVSPARNSAFVRSNARGSILQAADRDRESQWWDKAQLVQFWDRDENRRSSRFADPYVEEARPRTRNPDTFAFPYVGGKNDSPELVFSPDILKNTRKDAA